MESLIYIERPEDEGDGVVMHYGQGDMHEIFGAEKTAALQRGETVWHAGGLAVDMRHAAQMRLQETMETGEIWGDD